MISKKEVQRMAKLARLGLTEKEMEKYQKELSRILDWVEKLKETDVSKIKSTSHPFEAENMERKDEILKFNKRLIDGHLKVGSILK